MAAGVSESSGQQAYSVVMFGRLLAIIDEVSLASGPLGVTALSRRTGIPKATTHRLLAVLQAHEMVTRQREGFELGPGVRRMARLAHDRSTMDLRHLLMPYLVELYELTGDVVTLGLLDGGSVVILETVRGHQHRNRVPILDRIPAHCSAIGKLLLAHRLSLAPPQDDRLPPCTARSVTSWTALTAELPEIRARGFVVSHGEFLPHVSEDAMLLVGREGVMAGLGRMRPTGPPDDAAVAAHRRIASAASAALRRMVPMTGSGRPETGVHN
jgi:IclR family transcriptional regulator, KDG regulon repressor